MRLRKRTASARLYETLRRPATAIAAALLLAAWLPAGVGWAGEPADEPMWIPSLDIGFDTFSYSAKVDVTDLVPDSATAGGSGSGSALQLRMQLGGDVQGPQLGWLPWHPRVFVRGGVGLPPFGSDQLFTVGVLQQPPESDISTYISIRRGDFDTDSQPLNPRPAGDNVPDCYEQGPVSNPTPTCYTKALSDIRGNGSQVNVKLGDVSWYAGLGLDFEVPLGESLLLGLRPSLAYQGEPVKLSGQLVTTTVETVPVDFAPCRPNKTCPYGTSFTTQEFSVYRGDASTSLVDHSLGIGLELDLGLSRSSWPVRASLFVDTRFLWLLNDPVSDFSNPDGTVTTLPNAVTEVTVPAGFPVASYRVDRDPFEIRGGAGIRFSWVGFGQR